MCVLCVFEIFMVFFFHLFLLAGGLLLYSIIVGFVIHWHESAMELLVFPIPIPPPTSFSTRFLWVFPVHQAQALLVLNMWDHVATNRNNVNSCIPIWIHFSNSFIPLSSLIVLTRIFSTNEDKWKSRFLITFRIHIYTHVWSLKPPKYVFFFNIFALNPQFLAHISLTMEFPEW